MKSAVKELVENSLDAGSTNLGKFGQILTQIVLSRAQTKKDEFSDRKKQNFFNTVIHDFLAYAKVIKFYWDEIFG